MYVKIYTMQKKFYVVGGAGSGKTEYIKKMITEYSGNKLAVSYSACEHTPDFEPVTFEWLAQRIFSENGYEKKILADFLGIDIILNISKEIFKKNPTLAALTKSSRFSSELYNLFGALKNNLLTPDDLKKAVEISDISEIDRNRLALVCEVYEKYNEFLKENNLLDYRDAAGIAAGFEKLPDYDFIAVDGAQDMPFAQLELYKKISKNLLICADENAKIRLTSGVNPSFQDFETQTLKQSDKNSEILSQAFYLCAKGAKPVENIPDCLIFEDLHDELSFIAEDIKNIIKDKNVSYNDFAVLIRDNAIKQKILDIFKAAGIPAGIEIYDENLYNFKIKLNRYLNLCTIFERFKMNAFSKQDFESIGVMPRSEQEIIFEEMDLYVENILYDTVENGFAADRLLSIKEEHNKPSLLNVIYENIKTLSDNDAKALSMELGAVAKIYELYRENRFTDILFFCASKEKENIDPNRPEIRMLAGKIKDIEHLYGSLLQKKPSLSVILDVINQPVEREIKTKDYVRILPFFKAKGITFKHVYIPSLTEKTLPARDRFTQFISKQANDTVSAALQAINPCFIKIIPDEKTVMTEETALMYIGMTRAEKALTISTHTYEDKKQIQSSVFFNRLAVINPDKTQKIEREKENILFSNTEYKETEADTSTKVIQDGEILKLNASSIRNFQNCPRRYYLANLLNLKDKQTFSASYGTAVHTVMQVFFEKYLKQFNKNTLLNIAEAYFHCASAPQNALNAGFSQKDMDTLLTSDTLSIAEMHENFISAVDELEKKGFFNEVPDSAIAETAFYFKTEKIPDVEFDGRIDVITQKDGKFSLYDYKTGMQNKETLSHYVSENGVSFRTKTGKGNPEILKKEYPYQVPLYYIASLYSKNLEQIKGKLEYLGLKYIRPVINGGCVDDIIPAQSLEEYSDKILRNLKTEVADKIRETVEFKPEPDNFTCKNCPYEFLCDGGGDD